jgi:hypothetical protein
MLQQEIGARVLGIARGKRSARMNPRGLERARVQRQQEFIHPVNRRRSINRRTRLGQRSTPLSTRPFPPIRRRNRFAMTLCVTIDRRASFGFGRRPPWRLLDLGSALRTGRVIALHFRPLAGRGRPILRLGRNLRARCRRFLRLGFIAISPLGVGWRLRIGSFVRRFGLRCCALLGLNRFGSVRRLLQRQRLLRLAKGLLERIVRRFDRSARPRSIPDFRGQSRFS